MKIEIASLRLVGCGPFDDVTLDFCDANGKPKKTVLLAGANGSGKTTTIVSILELFETFHDYNLYDGKLKTAYAQFSIRIDGVYFTYYFGDKPDGIEIVGDRIGRKTGEALRRDGDRFDQIHGLVSDDSFGVWDKVRSTETIVRMAQIKDLIREYSKDDCPPTVLYFPHPRQLHSVQAEFLHQEEFRYTPVYRYKDSDAFPGSLSSYLIWLEYSEPEEYAATIQFLDSLQINHKRFGILRKKLQAVVTTPDGATHPVDGLSSGEQNLFVLLLELRRRLTRGSIVLIDEIEGSLHPAYQYKLIYALQKLQEEFDLQLILTTHSEEIFEAIGPENTLILTDFAK